ncbi:uncharacterized protein [Triticum aestivum]|uniref:uncharacterized protein n=1 Tax=Triticum aestivum TaxID=4565 RepID=UPI001D02D90F|nr:uncharacterized protein LOC123089270 [Triticum aestivum]
MAVDAIAAIVLPAPYEFFSKHPRRRLLRPRPLNQAGRARTLAIKLVVTAYIIVAAVDCRHFDRTRPHRPLCRDRYDGSQESDDATDDYYYPEDAYYYVKTADD